jgi:exosome complex exonuclease DIS3/RRP44
MDNLYCITVFDSDGTRQKVIVSDVNRALVGDRVVVKLNEIEHWVDNTAPSVTNATNATIATNTAAREEDEGATIKTFETSNAPMQPTSSLTPTGAVVSVTHRSPAYYTPLIGTVVQPGSNDNSNTYVFKPSNTDYPNMSITLQNPSMYNNMTLSCIITSYPLNSPSPIVRLVEVVGESSDKEVRTSVILQEYDIKLSTFTKEVLSCLPNDDYKPTMEEGRKDFRHLPILSIDPPGCKDIDDALHCHLLPNGNHSVGVHIADVTHYVKAGSAIDVEAGKRSTSTYLVDRRLDMLPGLLTTDLCSLKPNVDRYAFSVIWEIQPDGTIINAEFTKSIIHSIAGLTYQQAQEYIDTKGELKGGEGIKQKACVRLNELAKIFRAKRIEMGALTLASPEVKFKMDDSSLNPTDVTSYQLYEANELVEEFMLLANITVAKRILRQYPTLGVLRNHPAPERGMFDELIEKARLKNWVIDPTTSLTLADSLDQCTDADPELNKLLRILSTRCMRPAAYFVSGAAPPTEWHHFGLASPIYTHFTSPIRRYADVCVHRLLASAIGHEPLADHLSSKTVVADLCDNMNRRHRNAQLAGRKSVEMHTIMFFKAKGDTVVEGYVTDVREVDDVVKIGVFVPRYGIEGSAKLGADVVEGPVVNFAVPIRVSPGRDTVSVFDKVRVNLVVTEENEKSVMRIVFIEKCVGTQEPKRKREDSK